MAAWHRWLMRIVCLLAADLRNPTLARPRQTTESQQRCVHLCLKIYREKRFRELTLRQKHTMRRCDYSGATLFDKTYAMFPSVCLHVKEFQCNRGERWSGENLSLLVLHFNTLEGEKGISSVPCWLIMALNSLQFLITPLICSPSATPSSLSLYPSFLLQESRKG